MNFAVVWKEEKAQEYCSSVRDGTHDSPKFVDHGHPLITSKAIKDGALLLESADLISEKDFNEINKRSKVDQWDILFTMIGTLGEVYLEKGNHINYAIKNVGLFKCDDEIKARWLYLWFRNPTTKQAILQLRRGASQQYLPLGTLRELKIKYPSDWEYGKKIIDFTYLYDDLIENNKRRIELLEESARQLYKEWFVRFRFPGHEHVKIIDGVPEGWVKTTADLAMDILSGGTPKTSVPDYWDGEIGFFTPKDATDTVYVSSTEKTITKLGLEKCASNLYPKNTLFITARGTVGNLNLAQKPMAMNQSCYALVGREPINQLYLYFAMQAGIQQVKSRAVGAVFDAIIKDTFKVIPFLIPSKGLVEEFTDFVQPILAQIDTLMISTERLVQARDILLPKLMSGEIAV